MSKRQLINKGINDLESLYNSRLDDEDSLKLLKEELGHRKTNRAKKLNERVTIALNGFAKETQNSVKQKNKYQEPQAEIQTKLETEAKFDPKPVNQKVPTFSPKFVESPPPPITNSPENILSGWTAMEVLSPSSYRKPEDLCSGEYRRVAKLDRGPLPWEGQGEKAKPNYRLYYQVVLGSVQMGPAINALLKVYTDKRNERPQASGEAVLATVMLDKKGCLVGDEPVALSSFGWGVPVALSGDLSQLGNWSDVEKTLKEGLSERIASHDEDGEPIPLTSSDIHNAYVWLAETLGIDQSLIKPPSFAIRMYQYYKLPDPPEPILLNSFFLEDLAAARSLTREGMLPNNLKRYLGVAKPDNRQNLMTDTAAIEEALEPRKFPLGSWPSDGRHPLVMLQQCAVNLAQNDLKTDGILAVNGPPGTGKTTLLRDVIASIVTERAKVMTSFSDPEKAFFHSGEKIRKGSAFIHLYELDQKLRGFEIVVASSNNKAVENVSAELPGVNAIADDSQSLRYFKTISDNLLKRDSWGTIAAVLGNAKNRSSFRQDFWWDKDFGLQTYLQQAVGNPQFIWEGEEDQKTKRPPHVVTREDPPKNHGDAIQRWKKRQSQFSTALKETTKSLEQLQEVSELIQSMRKRHVIITALDGNIDQAKNHEIVAETNKISTEENYRNNEVEYYTLHDECNLHLKTKPGFIARLFNWSQYHEWKAKYANLRSQVKQAKESLSSEQLTFEQYLSTFNRLKEETESFQRQKDAEVNSLAQERSGYDAIVQCYGGILIDDKFFEKEGKDLQLSAPWLDTETARLRNNLFESAIAVHKAFVDAAAKPLRHNLNALMDSFGTRPLGSAEKDALIPHLWATLFLVVPVVSTTFASVSRMFNKLHPGDLGWLLIDEAGQSLPQAALGAIMRTQKAVVVGDPIQIEPIVVLPEQLTETICRRFGVDPVVYNAPGASAQTLSDSATAYFGTFETQFGTREVGVPLLVHRRCAEPMFSISNAIAYENLMVQAKAPKPSPIKDVLGASRWIDIQGHGQEKWCPEEGEEVLKIFQTLKEAGCKLDLYVVTPFVVVQNRMRERLRESGLLEGWAKDPYRWVNDHVGTIHTVQGREAEAIILLLGAPNIDQKGARNWAGGKPNLLNVATTRAQEVLYVVGNKNLWKGSGVFNELYRFL